MMVLFLLFCSPKLGTIFQDENVAFKWGTYSFINVLGLKI